MNTSGAGIVEPTLAQLSTKKLGKDGPQVTAMGFGCMGLSSAQSQQRPNEERFTLLDHVYKSGELFWDTADVYADNEDLLGQWFQRNPGARERVFLATKFGNQRDLKTGKMSVCNEPAYIRQQCLRSLQRLQTDHIDLYYMHRANKNQPIEVTVAAMQQLRQEGKVRYLGLSEVSSETLRRACKITHIDAVQMEYSPFSLEIEQEGLLSTCRELGVAVVAYAPLGKGLLTGTMRAPPNLEKGDARGMFPRFKGDNFFRNLALVDRIKAIADRKGCTSGQLVLAWLMQNDPLVFPIPGTTKIHNFNENVASFHVDLTDEDSQELRTAVSAAEVAGDRYPEMVMDTCFANTVALEQYHESQGAKAH